MKRATRPAVTPALQELAALSLAIADRAIAKLEAREAAAAVAVAKRAA